MVFVFDLDDTICDTDGYSEKFIKEFISKHNLPYKQIATNVRFAEMKFDWPHEIALEWYKTFGDEMFLHFPVKRNAVKIINNLFDAGHTIIISTARATDWHTKPQELTLEWLEKVSLKYSKVYVGRKDKEQICKEENADVFVDDDINIVSRVKQTFDAAGKGKVFLAQTNYNKTLPIPQNIQTISNFEDLLQVLELESINEI